MVAADRPTLAAASSQISDDAEAARLEMARVLVTALQAAERERDLAASREPTDSELARAAHDKLQYDFPIVTPRELDALTRAMESDPAAHPITAPLVDAAVEGASKPAPTDDPKDPAASNATPARTLRCAYQRLCAAVTVRLPHRLLALSDEDADRALARYRPRVELAPDDDRDPNPSDPLDHLTPAEDEPSRANEPSSETHAETHADSDSDSDWEPLEGDPSSSRGFDGFASASFGSRPPFDDPLARMSTGDRVDFKLADLLGRASYGCFDGADDASTAAAASRAASTWDASRLTATATEMTETFARAVARPNRRALRAIPARLLRERWAVAGPPVGGDAVSRVLSALGFDATRDAPSISVSTSSADPTGFGGDDDEDLALETLAYLCVRLGGVALGDAHANADVDARARAMWRHVDASLAATAARFGRLATTRDVDDPAWRRRVGMCSLIVAFHAARAAGNARVGDTLTRTGAMRAAAVVFTLPGYAAEPHAEALRRLTLVAAAAAPEAAKYLAAVPGFRDAVEGDAFGPDGACAAHGALWALLLPTDDPESAESACASRLAPLVARDGTVALAALGLLRATQSAAKARGRTLWRVGGAIDATLRDAAATHAATVAATARARDEERAERAAATERKTTASDDEKDEEDDRPEVRKERDDEEEEFITYRDGDDAAVAAVVAAAAAAAGSGANGDGNGAAEAAALEAAGLDRATGQGGDASRGNGRRRAADPEAEKRRETAATAIRLLKEILGAAEGGVGTRKCD